MKANFSTATKTIVLLATILFGACSDSTGPGESCTEQTRTIDVVWGDYLEDFNRNKVTELKASGWECPHEALYNAFGNQFGIRYICHICD